MRHTSPDDDGAQVVRTLQPLWACICRPVGPCRGINWARIPPARGRPLSHQTPRSTLTDFACSISAFATSAPFDFATVTFTFAFDFATFLVRSLGQECRLGSTPDIAYVKLSIRVCIRIRTLAFVWPINIATFGSVRVVTLRLTDPVSALASPFAFAYIRSLSLSLPLLGAAFRREISTSPIKLSFHSDVIVAKRLLSYLHVSFPNFRYHFSLLLLSLVILIASALASASPSAFASILIR